MPFDDKLIDDIVEEARHHSSELPWVEFRENDSDSQGIGEYISALSNTAALYNQEHAFMIWGVCDETYLQSVYLIFPL